jgi:hypothetical protein
VGQEKAMRTKLTIMAIILALDLAAVAVGVLLVLTLGGWTGPPTRRSHGRCPATSSCRTRT